MDLDELWKKSSNAPAGPTTRVPSAKTRQIVRAITQGHGPVIAEQQARIKALETENTALRADLVSFKAELAVIKARIGSREIEDEADPMRRYSSPAVSRLLS